MKSTKVFFFILAGIWSFYLIIDKITGFIGAHKIKTISFPIKLIYKTAGLFKSSLIYCLIFFNIMMAILLIEDKKK
ncbi:MAG: hypothetical protein PVI26_09590 [Chitinispirillia bacterium]